MNETEMITTSGYTALREFNLADAMVMLAQWCADQRPELVPLFELVQEYRKWSKLKTTYIDGYLKHISDVTGRIHPDLLPLATETGRFAARNPNMDCTWQWRIQVLKPVTEINANPFVINLKNGLYNVLEETLKPHSPDFCSTVQIQAAYQPEAQCPQFMEALLSGRKGKR